MERRLSFIQKDVFLNGACIGVCPTKVPLLDAANNYSGQIVPLHKNGVFIKGWAEDAALYAAISANQ